MDLYAAFNNLTKGFDTVDREALWVILSKLGCPRKFTHTIRLFHDGMIGLVVTPLLPSSRVASLPQFCLT